MTKPAAAATITVTATRTLPGQGCSFEEAVVALNNRVAGDCVAGNGNNDTINIVANAAPYVASGINIDIHRSVTINGAGLTSTVLQFSGGARGGETALRTSGGPGIVVAIRNLTLRGTAGNQLTGIENLDDTVTLSNLRLTNFGYAGVTNVDGSLTIGGSTIDHNGVFGELPLGGGVHNGGDLVVNSTTISNNFAFRGGGLANFGPLQVTNSLIFGNQALENGGGAYSLDGSTNFTSTVFDSNDADAGGGAYIDVGGNGMFTTSTFKNNSAADGGGVAVNGNGGSEAHVYFQDSLLANNFAAGRGGGLFSTGQVGPNANNTTFSENQADSGGGVWHESGGELDLVSCTIAFNHAETDGGGLHMNPGTSGFHHNLIVGNTADAFPDVSTPRTTTIGAYNLIQTFSDGLDLVFPAEDHNILGVVNPLVGPLQNLGGSTAVCPLLDYSPALDAIPPSAYLGINTDQRGFPRPQDGNDGASRNGFDIGAYEQGPNESILGFERVTGWTSTAPLALSTARKTQGLSGLSVGGNGYRVLNSAPLKTPLVPLGVTMSVDFFLPSSQPNPSWFGAVQAYASCPSAALYNAYLGQVELTGKPTNTFSTLTFTLPANVRTALSQPRTDCFISLALNTNATPVAPVLDNLRFNP